ncbi:MAG: hypothetical protein OEV42_20585 [Deltaproteobacteria bacterium]|nr:hypothetical protein [Deltaproteobacteria bacterium]
MRKRLSLEECREVAQKATQEALRKVNIPKVIKDDLVLGTRWNGDLIIFELYLPGKRPEDALIISKATVNSCTGKVFVVVKYEGDESN